MKPSNSTNGTTTTTVATSRVITRTNTSQRYQWRNRFILISGVLLFTTGVITTVICCYEYLTRSSTADNGEEITSEDNGNQRWLIVATGLFLLVAGCVLISMYCWIAKRFQNLENPKIVQKSQQQLPTLAEQGKGKGLIVNLNEEQRKSANSIKPLKKNADNEDLADIPSQAANHYKRRLNQHGYGSRNAPIANIDETNCSLRSSMNSLWSQHMHQQMQDFSEEFNNKSDNESESSFQSAYFLNSEQPN